MHEILIRNACLLGTGGPGDFIEASDLLIRDGKIADIAPRIDGEFQEVVDATDMIVMPGLVDTHRHTWQSVLRHRLGDADFDTYRCEMLRDVGAVYRPEDVYIGTLLGAVAALEAGTTTLLDWAHVMNSPEHADAAIAALRESGIRGIFAHGWPRTEGPLWALNSERPHLADIRRIRRDVLSSGDALVTLAMAARGPEMTNLEVTRADFALARELGIRTTMHVGTGALGPRFRAIELMHREGLLGPDLTVVHVCTSSDEELAMLAEAGVKVSLGPQIELTVGGIGPLPVGRLLKHGIKPSLSGDTETAGAGDIFTQMRMVLAGDRAISHNQFLGMTTPPVRVRDALDFATIVGADACGLGERTGSLVRGKAADLTFVRKTDLNLTPVSDPIGAIVLGAHPGNVDSVMVNGRFVKRAGKLIGIDSDRIKAKALESRDYLLSTSGRGRLFCHGGGHK